MSYIKVPIKEERLGLQGITLTKLLDSASFQTKSTNYICGGFARYCASPVASPALPRDIDIYTGTNYSFNLLKDWILYDGMGSKIYYEEGQQLGEDVIQFTPKVNSGFTFPVQIMSPKFGNTVKEVLNRFDFSICRAAILSKKMALVDPEFIEHEIKRRLILRTNPQPKNLLARTLKYISKGYFVPSALHLIQLIGLAKDMKQEELRYIFKYANNHNLLEGMFGGDLDNMYQSLMEEAK